MSPEKVTDLANHLIEECAELIQALRKAERFGWHNYHPDRPNSTNIQEVSFEMIDVQKRILGLNKELYK
jgi:NTP pyrophosphatase (non-canonical NTP hydrolase)